MVWYLESTTNEPWAYASNIFSPEECDLIISMGNKLQFEKGTVGANVSVNHEIRKSSISFFESTDSSAEWIFRRLTDLIVSMNKNFWGYDLHYVENLQFTKYSDVNDFYGPHMDQLYKSPHHRKLSLSVQLSDPKDYEGSELLIYSGSKMCPANKQRGDVIFFPSFMLHEVTPITKGERCSLVGWVCGPRLR